MEINHVIQDKLYTNSLLICPISDESSIISYTWIRKNSPFLNGREKILTLSNPDLYYQCSLFDFNSTIELLVVLKDSRIIYTYGPICLQQDLLQYPQNESFLVKVQLGRREAMEGVLRVCEKKEKKEVKAQVEMKNQMKLEISCPPWSSGQDYENTLRVLDNKPEQIQHNFAYHKVSIIEILKKLKIYSYEGHYIKYIFKNQRQRDNFLYRILLFVGFHFPQTKSNYLITKHKKTLSSLGNENLLSGQIISPNILGQKKQSDAKQISAVYSEKTLQQEESSEDTKTQEIYTPSYSQKPYQVFENQNTPKKKYKLPNPLKQKQTEEKKEISKLLTSYGKNQNRPHLEKENGAKDNQEIQERMKATFKKRLMEGVKGSQNIKTFQQGYQYSQKQKKSFKSKPFFQPPQIKPCDNSYRKQSNYRSPINSYHPHGQPLFPIPNYFPPDAVTNIKSVSHLPQYKNFSIKSQEKPCKRQVSKSFKKPQQKKPTSNWSKK